MLIKLTKPSGSERFEKGMPSAVKMAENDSITSINEAFPTNASNSKLAPYTIRTSKIAHMISDLRFALNSLIKIFMMAS